MRVAKPGGIFCGLEVSEFAPDTWCLVSKVREFHAHFELCRKQTPSQQTCYIWQTRNPLGITKNCVTNPSQICCEFVLLCVVFLACGTLRFFASVLHSQACAQKLRRAGGVVLRTRRKFAFLETSKCYVLGDISWTPDREAALCPLEAPRPLISNHLEHRRSDVDVAGASASSG